jgi:7-carboxy-7-deazaguanine synthase
MSVLAMADKQLLQLKINEIFYSIQGETTLAGLPTVFIRLTGCPLRCGYCDTSYAFHTGNMMTIKSVLEQAATYKPQCITVSGGEPLAQQNVLYLLELLCDSYANVSLETSGALDIAPVDSRVIKILDIKTPGSQMSAKNMLSNLDYLLPHDQLKFVICNEHDFNWSLEFLAEHNLLKNPNILFSPSYHDMSLKKLADLIISANAPVRLQAQLHKIIWGDIPGK